MKRKNKTYEYETNREEVQDVDFEQLLIEFRKESNERRKKNKKNRRR